MLPKVVDEIEEAEVEIVSLVDPAAEDAALVVAAKSGDRQAFEVLVRRHQRRILTVAFRITRVREDAEDIVQQSFQKAFVHLQQFEGNSSFSTWLTRIAINEALMLRRNGRRWREVSIDDSSATDATALVLEIDDSSSNPELGYFQQERRRILFSAINELRPRIRIALQACDLSERSVRETARILGVSATAVKSRVNRGRKILGKELKRYVDITQTNQARPVG